MQKIARAASKLPAFAGKKTSTWRAKTPAIAGKTTCNRRQKYPSLEEKTRAIAVKVPAFAGKTAIIQRVKSPANFRLDCILQMKLTPNCILNYKWSHSFCVRFWPRRCR